ncbi:MAG TPA: amino acid adenylation domain-containing protein, partial [Thermoanaerobaculia bacterium]|nr:amino acid adenylation domain-containing protein [Thermoanaerobaculia bacterium]
MTASAPLATVVDLFAELHALGIKLWLEGGELRFRAPRGALSDELKEALRSRREDIVEFLRSARESRQVPPVEPADRHGVLPLSFPQERLWFLEQWRPAGIAAAAYNIVEAVRLCGPLDRRALAGGLQDVVDRHEVLRTTFAALEGQPRQVVHPRLDVPLALTDLANLAEQEPAAAEAEALRLLSDEAHHAFDLERGPLLRATLARIAPDQHFLVLNLHHIVSDGWSTAVLIRDLVAFYEARAAARLDAPHAIRSSLPPLPVQYADYAVWQRRWLSGGVLDEQIAYWRERLRGAPDVLELPADRPRPPEQSFRGDTLELALPAGTSAGLERLAESGTTRFMLLLTGFAALLGRLAGVDDLLIGTPVANRRRAELEPLIGFFVNTLVIRAELAGRPSFRQLLARVRDSTIGAFAHADLPFERLVEELQPVRDKSRTPLIQVMFVLQNTPEGSLTARGLQLAPLALPQRTAKFDLTLTVVDGPPPLSAALEFSTDLFDAATVRRFGEYWQRLLAGAAADPDTPLTGLPLLSEAEQSQLAAWNATGRDYDLDCTLDGLIADQTARTPDAVALVFEDQALTYAELGRRASRLAAELSHRGAGPETIVGICAERSLELVVGLLAILRSGAAYLPLDPAYPQERLAFMLEDAQIALLLTQSHLIERLPPHGAQVLDLETVRTPLLPRAQRGQADPPLETSGDNLAYLIFTSGSTGRPKGAMNEHRAIVNRLLWMQDAYGLTTIDHVLQKTPFSFDVSVWEFFWPLLTGARLVLAIPGGHQDARYLARTITEQEITTLHFVPPMLRAFLEKPEVAGCTSLTRVICSGEALPFDLQQRFFARLGATGAGLHNLYGPTEAAVDVTYWECERNPAREAVPIGYPVANTAIHLLDRDGNPAPVGVHGELLIGGVQVGRGYLGRPALTAERFVPDPFGGMGARGARAYRTGDLARRLPGGEVEYLGRIDHQVKVRGFRIELGEIETALAAVPGVRETVVLATASAALVAYVAADDSVTP